MLLLLLFTITNGFAMNYLRRKTPWTKAFGKCGKKATCQCKPSYWYRRYRSGKPPAFKAFTYCPWNHKKCSCDKGLVKMGSRCYGPKPAGMKYKKPDQQMKKKCLSIASCKKLFENANAAWTAKYKKNIANYKLWAKQGLEDIAKFAKELQSTGLTWWRKRFLRGQIRQRKRSAKMNVGPRKYYENLLKKGFAKLKKYNGMTRPEFIVLDNWARKKRLAIRKIWRKESKKATCTCSKEKTIPQCSNYGRVLYRTCGCSNTVPTVKPTVALPCCQKMTLANMANGVKCKICGHAPVRPVMG